MLAYCTSSLLDQCPLDASRRKTCGTIPCPATGHPAFVPLARLLICSSRKSVLQSAGVKESSREGVLSRNLHMYVLSFLYHRHNVFLRLFTTEYHHDRCNVINDPHRAHLDASIVAYPKHSLLLREIRAALTSTLLIDNAWLCLPTTLLGYGYLP